MFIFNVFNEIQIINVVIEQLKCKGVKCKFPKKAKDMPAVTLDAGPKVFQTPLVTLPKIDVSIIGETLVISIPVFLYESCSTIEENIDVEGIFRKAGSIAKQRQLKQLLNSGKQLDNTCHVIDVCNLVKLFFRELPEPIIPYYAHDMLLSCMVLSGENAQKDALLLCVLLLQPEHLAVLTYFMRLLQKVALHSLTNKMDSSNLAIVLTPSVMPIEQKGKSRNNITISHHIAVVKMLIDNAEGIGVVPEPLVEQAKSLRGRKRRSASITRMFTGIRKMVGRRSFPQEVEERQENTPRKRKTPELMPPAVTVKRRKEVADTTPGLCRMKGYSLSSLRSSDGLTTPQRKSLPSAVESASKSADALQLGRKRVVKPSKSASNLLLNKRKSLERKLSSMTWRKRRASFKADRKELSKTPEEPALNTADDFVTISRHEYEEMKTRVNCMEQMIVDKQIEEENVQPEALATQLTRDLRIRRLSSEMASENAVPPSPALSVQEAFEQAVEQTEHLAPQIRRDARLRWSTERKIARSPSERKIGSIRRRSRELARSNSAGAKTSLQRGRPNTKQTGLPSPRDGSESRKTRSHLTTASPRARKSPSLKNEVWLPPHAALAAPGLKHLQSTPERRDSIASIRKNNIGMVHAKAKFFDSLNYSIDGEGENSNLSLERKVESLHKELIRMRTGPKENRRPLIKPALGSAKLKTPKSELRLAPRIRATPLKALPDMANTPQRGMRRSPRILARSLSQRKF